MLAPSRGVFSAIAEVVLVRGLITKTVSATCGAANNKSIDAAYAMPDQVSPGARPTEMVSVVFVRGSMTRTDPALYGGA